MRCSAEGCCASERKLDNVPYLGFTKELQTWMISRQFGFFLMPNWMR
jgi:hypothetical protein